MHTALFHLLATPNIWAQTPLPNWYMPSTKNTVSAHHLYDTGLDCFSFNTCSQTRSAGGRTLLLENNGVNMHLPEAPQVLVDQPLSWPQQELTIPPRSVEISLHDCSHLVHPLIPFYFSPEKQSAFICKWENCTSTHDFRREIDLMRHMKTIQVAPQAFLCQTYLCGKAFSRKDKLRYHMSRVHRVKLK
jgi:hypothetical protein